MSVEAGTGLKLTAIDGHFGNTGQYGYGTCAIGDATVRVLGSRLDVGSYATVIAGPAAVVHCGDSTRAAVAALDTELELGLSEAELAAPSERTTEVDSGRFGYMSFGTGDAHRGRRHARRLRAGRPPRQGTADPTRLALDAGTAVRPRAASP